MLMVPILRCPKHCYCTGWNWWLYWRFKEAHTSGVSQYLNMFTIKFPLESHVRGAVQAA